MELWPIVLIAFALSVDNAAIALAVGAQLRTRTLAATLRLPVVFGAFAAGAPALGWFAGSQIAGAISKYGSVVACAILLYIGWRTLRSAWQSVNGGIDASSVSATLALGLSTSVDSLTAGFAMALAHANVVTLAFTNGAICGLLSLAGILAGERLGENFPSQGKIAAGIVLIVSGLRVLLAHP